MKSAEQRNIKMYNGQRAVCNSSGFTLLEIMIALAIIGIALTVIIHTVNYHAAVMNDNTVTTRMVQAAKEKLYELEMNPQDSRGNIPATGLHYQNIVSGTDDDSNIFELKTVVTGYGKQVVLNKLVVLSVKIKGTGTDK